MRETEGIVNESILTVNVHLCLWYAVKLSHIKNQYVLLTFVVWELVEFGGSVVCKILPLGNSQNDNTNNSDLTYNNP